jgi:hypothetical protein
MYRMKVTALISDEIINEVRSLSGGETITEAITIALKEWISQTRIRQLNREVVREPLLFYDGYSADAIRDLNRQ